MDSTGSVELGESLLDESLLGESLLGASGVLEVAAVDVDAGFELSESVVGCGDSDV